MGASTVKQRLFGLPDTARRHVFGLLEVVIFVQILAHWRLRRFPLFCANTSVILMVNEGLMKK
jgi:hypothetical protein